MRKVIIISPAYPLRGGISESTELLYLEYIKKEVDCQIISYNLQYPKGPISSNIALEFIPPIIKFLDA